MRQSSFWLAAAFVPLWSTGFITARLVAPHADPMTFLTLRFAIAGALLAGFAGLIRAPWPRSPRAALDAVTAGLMIHGLYLGCVFWGVAHGVPAGVSALVAGLQPILTGFLARPLLGERVSPVRWIGIGVGAAGAALVIAPKLGVPGGIPFWPLVVCFVGTVAITLGTIWQKRRGASADLRTGTALQYVGALVPVTAGMLLAGSYRFDGAAEAWIGLGWSVFGMSIGAISLLMILIRRGAVAQVASLLYLVPGVSAVMAYALFGETLLPLQIAGLAVAAAGVAIASRV